MSAEGAVSTPVPRGSPPVLTPVQPPPLRPVDVPNLPVRESLQSPVLCPSFRQVDAVSNVTAATLPDACTARILTGPHRGSTCGKPAKVGHLCGLHAPTRKRRRQQQRSMPIDGVDTATVGLMSNASEQCTFMRHGSAGRPDVQCRRKTRDPSRMCHCHRGVAPRKTRKYKHVPVALRERAIALVVQSGLSSSQAGRLLSLPRQTVYDVVRHYELTGEMTRTNRHLKPPNVKATQDIVAFVRQQVRTPKLQAASPGGKHSMTLRALCDMVWQEFGTRLSVSTMQRIVKSAAGDL